MKNQDAVLILTWHDDPGHEWLEISSALISLEMLNAISKYSYYDHVNGRYFLEGDCDAAVALDALTPVYDIAFRHKHYENEPPFLRLPRVGSDT